VLVRLGDRREPASNGVGRPYGLGDSPRLPSCLSSLAPLFCRAVGFSSSIPPPSPEPPEALGGLSSIEIATGGKCSREEVPVGLIVLVRTAP